MAARKLSRRGRVLAAGATVGLTAGLVGAMAATEQAATVRSSTTGSIVSPSDDAGRSSTAADDGAQPYSSSDSGSSTGSSNLPSTPSAHTRTGGS